MNLLDKVLPPAVSPTNERQNREAHDHVPA
jgi:hypothetical protein